MKLYKQQIIDIFTDDLFLQYPGIFYSGKKWEGLNNRWHENGALMYEGEFNGMSNDSEVKVGKHLVWHDNGVLNVEEYFDNKGNKIKSNIYDRDGNLYQRV